MSKDKKKKTLSIPPENPKLIQKGSSRKVDIYNGGSTNIQGGNIAAQTINPSFNKVDEAEISSELKDMLKELVEAVANLSENLPKDMAQEMVEDLEILTSEAISKTPRKRWWQISVEGLIKASENIGEIGKPVLELTAKIVTILSAK